ncbi:MAG: hypothetical protein IPO40_23715 [Fibrobacteres bacterium]|nr:hypothetical protein [Fibrobacterota bacterium]
MKQPFSLTTQFHVDALRAQHEFAPLGTRFQRPELQMSDSMKTACGRDI